MYSHIMIATDGSRLSGKAVKAGVALAKALGAKVTGFYAMPEYPVTVYSEGSAFSSYITPSQFLKQEKERAAQILSVLQREAKKAGVTAATDTVQKSSPYEAIIRAARSRKCDLIVMASHGRRGIAGMLLGSETQKVLTHSTIPVLVVR